MFIYRNVYIFVYIYRYIYSFICLGFYDLLYFTSILWIIFLYVLLSSSLHHYILHFASLCSVSQGVYRFSLGLQKKMHFVFVCFITFSRICPTVFCFVSVFSVFGLFSIWVHFVKYIVDILQTLSVVSLRFWFLHLINIICSSRSHLGIFCFFFLF